MKPKLRVSPNKADKMLLAIDIGNTNINLGVFRNRRLIKRYAIPTQKTGYLSALKKILVRNKIDDIIICSVVPESTARVKRTLRKIFKKNPIIIGKDIIVPVKNLYRKPKQVGQDRLVNAYAGISLYGAPLIVVDFGTAITFDVISRNKEYLGGMILPGPEISLDMLFRKAALLPKVKLDRPKELIGRDTKSSILSGIVYGFAALTDDLVERIKNRIGKSALVIGTGGIGALIARYCKNISRLDKDLTLKGLNLIFTDRQRKYI